MTDPIAKKSSRTEVGFDRNLRFMRVLWALDHALQSRSKQMQSDLGVTGPQRLAIRILGGNPGISPGELAEVLHLHPSTLTGILARLVRRGLVRRRIDPTDARRSVLELSPSGRRIERSREGTVEDAIGRALDRFPATRLAATTEVLETLASRLENRGTKQRRGRATSATSMSAR